MLYGLRKRADCDVLAAHGDIPSITKARHEALHERRASHWPLNC